MDRFDEKIGNCIKMGFSLDEIKERFWKFMTPAERKRFTEIYESENCGCGAVDELRKM